MLEISLLGQFDVKLNGQTIVLPTRPSKLLLAYLALNAGKDIPRTQLGGILWPESLESTARKNLRNTVWRLRKAVGDEYVLSDRETVAFNDTAPHHLDVALLAKKEEPRGTEELIQIVSAYKGELLPGFYEDWVLLERDNLRAKFDGRIQKLMEDLIDLERWPEVISWAEQWISMGSVPEPAYRALMIAHTRQGDLAGMATAYQRCVQALKNELGVQPSAETEMLYQELSSKQTPEEKPPASQSDPKTIREELQAKLPIPTTPFIGREQELNDLSQLLIDAPDNNLVTLVGPGGIGKSRLALEAATTVADDFRDGVFFIPLAPLEDPEHIITTIAEIIELRFYSSGNPRQMLIDYLSRKNMLLVLDNFEHIMVGAELVADILRNASGVKILTTSRERLHLINEAIYVLGGLKYPEGSLLDYEFVVQELASYGSMKLLAHHARLVRPDLGIDDDQIMEMARLCRLVQGMPLAIILAASWLDLLSFQDAYDEIAHSLDFLESQMLDVPERQRSVRAAFDHSWKMLSIDDQQAFSRLSVFRGGFTRQAAQTITGASLKTLRKLVDKSLISSLRPNRFEIHELLRQYAEEKLDASGISEKIRQSHMTYYLNAVAQREADLKGKRQLEALEEIEVDLENVRVAWNWAVYTQSTEKIDETLEGLCLFFKTRSRQREGHDFFQMATEQLNLEDSELLLGRLLARKSFFMARFATGEESGLDDLEKSLSIANQHENLAEIAFTQLALGYYQAFVLGHNYAIALEHFQKSYALYQKLGDRYYCAKALHRIGYCYGNSEGHEKYMKYTREAMELAREIGDKFDLAVALGNLASGGFARGEYDDGESYLQESLILAEELGDRVSLAHSTMQDGIYHFLHGKIEEAKLLAEKGLMIASDLNFSVTTAYSLAVIGLCEAITGAYGKAVDLAIRSEEIPSNPFGGFLARWAQTIAYCGIGELEQAKRNGEKVLQITLEFNWPAMITWLLPVYVIISAQEERWDEAVSLLALAETHPMSILGWAEKWDIYNQIKGELAAELDQDQYQKAWNKGLNLELEETAARLIATFES